MNWRYLPGDLLVNLMAGALTGVASAAIVNESWPMLAAMPAGMLLGMALAFPLGVWAGTWLGAFEVMLPTMLTGMVAGMVVSMVAAMRPLGLVDAAALGGAAGAICLLLALVADALLRGEQTTVRPD